MQVVCVGLDHRRAPVEVRECVSFAREDLRAALHLICASARVDQVAILSTCNRTEVYAVAQTDARPQVRHWLIGQSNGGAPDLERCLYELSGPAAAVHLCSVAAGAESQVLGESEILGQVKGAMDAAREAETLGPELERLFLTAVRAGKRARNETAIGRGFFSVGRCAVETAKTALGGLDGKVVLILGAGKMAKSTASHLHERGADTILVANRTFRTAQDFARQLGGRALRYDQLPEGLQVADIVIASTSAPHYVLLYDQIEEAMAKRNGRELLLIDIAVPRDIDPRAADIPGTHLCDIDDLDCVVRSAGDGRADEIDSVRELAGEHATDFSRWLAERSGVVVLRALHDRAEQARQETLARFESEVRRLGVADRDLLNRVTHSLVKRFLHAPTVNLKRELTAGNGDVVDALARVYGLEADCDSAQAVAPRGASDQQGMAAREAAAAEEPNADPLRGRGAAPAVGTSVRGGATGGDRQTADDHCDSQEEPR